MTSQKWVTFLLTTMLAQICLLILLIVAPVYAGEGAFCTSCSGGCVAIGCDYAACWATACHCGCTCCVGLECHGTGGPCGAPE
jgi:hypothetical protein